MTGMTRRLPFILLLSACGLLAGCRQPTASINDENLVTRNCSAGKLRHAIDDFRLQPSDENRATVTRELAGLDERIQSLEDKAELVEGTAKAQLLFDAKALRTALAFDFERFNAPIEARSPVAVAKAEAPGQPQAVAEPATPLAAAPPATVSTENVEVRSAIALATPMAELVENIPVRRAVPVAAAMVRPVLREAAVLQSDDRIHIPIWQPIRETPFHPELARR